MIRLGTNLKVEIILYGILSYWSFLDQNWSIFIKLNLVLIKFNLFSIKRSEKSFSRLKKSNLIKKVDLYWLIEFVATIQILTANLDQKSQLKGNSNFDFRFNHLSLPFPKWKGNTRSLHVMQNCNKSNNLKVGSNLLCNQFCIVNGQVELDLIKKLLDNSKLLARTFSWDE